MLIWYINFEVVNNPRINSMSLIGGNHGIYSRNTSLNHFNTKWVSILASVLSNLLTTFITYYAHPFLLHLFNSSTNSLLCAACLFIPYFPYHHHWGTKVTRCSNQFWFYGLFTNPCLLEFHVSPKIEAWEQLK